MLYEVLKYDIVDDEIEHVILYYEKISYQLGLTVENAIEKALDNLERSPEHYFDLKIISIAALRSKDFLMHSFTVFLIIA